MHLFGWAQRPVDRYKAYDCFCRARSAGCAAASNNRAVCKWLGYGCKQHEEEAVAQLTDVTEAATSAPLKYMSAVSFRLAWM
jgi:hypothetical protein